MTEITTSKSQTKNLYLWAKISWFKYKISLLSLPLFVPGILANNHDFAFAANDFAIVANSLDR